jgi:hypothetical protein
MFRAHYISCFQVTDEEKLQIAQHFLLSSPPGQFQEVLTGSQNHTIYFSFLYQIHRCQKIVT